VLHYLVFELFNLVVSLVYLFCHLLDMKSCFRIVPLEVQNMLTGHFQLFVLRLYKLTCVAV